LYNYRDLSTIATSTKNNLIKVECTKTYSSFQVLGRKEIVANFSSGIIISDGGGILLQEVEHRTGILHGFAKCFTDHRDRRRIEHSVFSLVSQRVTGLALENEYLNDHDHLTKDQMLVIAVSKTDSTGIDRKSVKDKGRPLTRKSTLNKLELTPPNATPKSNYKK